MVATKNIRDIKLIEAVKKQKCLYDRKHKDYRLNDYRKHVWSRIGKHVGMTGESAKKRWKHFRDVYRRRPRPIKVNGITRKQCLYADHLRFLDNVMFNTKNNDIQDEDAEVSTDLSSNNEFLYNPTSKRTKNGYNNLPDEELQQIFNDSWNDEDGNDVEDNNEIVETMDGGTNQILDNENVVEDSCNGDGNAVGNNEKREILTKNMSTNQNLDMEGAREECLNIQQSIKKNKENSKNCQEVTILDEKLIDEVKKYEFIYNFESEQYKDNQYRSQIWKKIAKRLGITANQARSKWKNFRDGYRKYKIKVLNESGFVKPYIYADRLKFLDDLNSYKPFAINATTKNSLSDQEVSTDLSGCDDDNEDDDILQVPTSTKPLRNEHIKKSPPSHKLDGIPYINTEDVNVNANNNTISLFKILVNKINEANFNAKERNDVEFAVSRVVYSKLAEYAKTSNTEL